MKPILELKNHKASKQLIEVLKDYGTKFTYSFNDAGNLVLKVDGELRIPLEVIDLYNLRQISVTPIKKYRYGEGCIVLSNRNLYNLHIKLEPEVQTKLKKICAERKQDMTSVISKLILEA